MTYDHLTDKELLQHADGQSGLIKALSERLEMRLRDVEELQPPSNIRQLDLFEENENA
jgi:hypothetical protein